MDSSVSGTIAFGPVRTGHFDFTLGFIFSILTVLPTSIFILYSLWYIPYNISRPAVVRWGALLWAKFVAGATLIAFEVAALSLWQEAPSRYRSNLGTAAASLSCAAAIFTIAFMYVEHRHKIEPSAFLGLYLFSVLLFDIATARSLLIRHDKDLRLLAVVIAVAGSQKLVLIILNEISKAGDIEDAALRASLGKESISGFWNRSLFLWLNPILAFGFRSTLSVEQLENLGPEFSSRQLLDTFNSRWEQKKSSKRRLLSTLVSCLKSALVAPIVPQLMYTGFRFSQPFLLRRVIQYVRDGEQSEDTSTALICGTVLIYSGIMITRAIYNHRQYRAATLVRGTLVASICDHMLHLPPSKENAALTLMNADVQRIALAVPSIHNLMISVVAICLGIYFLSETVEQASVLAIFPILLASFISAKIGNRIGPAMGNWHAKTQARVSATAGMLSQMKFIKMTGLAGVMTRHIQRLREAEIEASKKARWLNTLMYATLPLSFAWTPIIIIAGGLFWTTFRDGINAVDIFTTMAFVKLIINPLFTIMSGWTTMGGALGCIGRVQVYLELKRHVDNRRGQVMESQLTPKIDLDRPSYDDAASTKSEMPPDNKMFPIEFVNALISPRKGVEAVLRGVNLRIIRSKLNLVISPTGAGKSLLLRAILGEAFVEGLLYAEQRLIAYCDEHPWIRDTTLRMNVVGSNAWDAAWYETCIRVCLLKEDFASMKFGDNSMAGINGANLSGGQKVRLGLARAMYCRAPVAVLDDIFNSLDPDTAASIFSSLFSPTGVFTRAGTTVILATHNVEYIDTTDHIVIIDTEGRVASKNMEKALKDKTIRAMQLKKKSDKRAARKNLSVTATSSGKVVEEPSTKADESDDTVAQAVAESNERGDLSARRNGDTSLYMFFLKSASKRLLIPWLAATILVAVFEHMPQIYMRVWVDVDPTNKLYFVGLVLIAVFASLINMFMAWIFLLNFVPQSAAKLHDMLLNTVLRSRIGVLTTGDNGSTLNRFSQDMSILSEDLPMAFMITSYLLFIVVTDIAVIAAGAAYAALMIPFVCAILYCLQYFYLRTSRQMRFLDLEAKAPLLKSVAENFVGVVHIRSFRWQKKASDEMLRELDYSQKPYYYMFCIQRWLLLVLDFSSTAMAAALVAFALKSKSTAPAIGLALLTVADISETISDFMDEWIQLETSLGAVARLRNLIADTPTEEDPAGDGGRPEWPEMGRIDFKNVFARYSNPAKPESTGNAGDKTSASSPGKESEAAAEKPPERTTADSKSAALQDFSLHVPAGQKAVIIGRTGSGKSSIFFALLNFLYHSGTIQIDGVDVSDMPRDHLRSQIITITQEPVVLPGTIRDNLVPVYLAQQNAKQKRPISDDDIKDTLESVEISEHIERMGGLNAPMSECELSKGQQQLFSLARGLIQKQITKSMIVLIDEGSSSMDFALDARIETLMNDAFADCTRLVITHRVQTVQGADIVVEMSHGRRILADEDIDVKKKRLAGEEEEEREKEVPEKKRKPKAAEAQQTMLREVPFTARAYHADGRFEKKDEDKSEKNLAAENQVNQATVDQLQDKLEDFAKVQDFPRKSKATEIDSSAQSAEDGLSDDEEYRAYWHKRATEKVRDWHMDILGKESDRRPPPLRQSDIARNRAHKIVNNWDVDVDSAAKVSVGVPADAESLGVDKIREVSPGSAAEDSEKGRGRPRERFGGNSTYGGEKAMDMVVEETEAKSVEPAAEGDKHEAPGEDDATGAVRSVVEEKKGTSKERAVDVSPRTEISWSTRKAPVQPAVAENQLSGRQRGVGYAARVDDEVTDLPGPPATEPKEKGKARASDPSPGTETSWSKRQLPTKPITGEEDSGSREESASPATQATRQESNEVTTGPRVYRTHMDDDASQPAADEPKKWKGKGRATDPAPAADVNWSTRKMPQ